MVGVLLCSKRKSRYDAATPRAKILLSAVAGPQWYLLVEAMAMQQGKRTTALLREMVYDALERALPASEYRAAEAADCAAWTDSVKRRVQGRQRSRQEAADTQQNS